MVIGPGPLDDEVMRRHSHHATLALTVALLAGCTSAVPDPETTSTATTSTDAAASSTDTREPASAGTPTVSAGAYIDRVTYERSPERYHSGKVVLFFHAPWCPVCREVEESLTSGRLPAGLTVVKVDFDSDVALRRRYGVTTQHTFVQVDEAGTLLARWTTSRTGDEILAGTQ